MLEIAACLKTSVASGTYVRPDYLSPPVRRVQFRHTLPRLFAAVDALEFQRRLGAAVMTDAVGKRTRSLG